MQHINCIAEARELDNAECTGEIEDAKFANTDTDRTHRLPIIGKSSALNPAELMTRRSARAFREVLQVVEAAADPDDGFIIEPHYA